MLSDKQRRVLQAISEVAAKLTDMELERLLAFSEGIACMTISPSSRNA